MKWQRVFIKKSLPVGLREWQKNQHLVDWTKETFESGNGQMLMALMTNTLNECIGASQGSAESQNGFNRGFAAAIATLQAATRSEGDIVNEVDWSPTESMINE